MKKRIPLSEYYQMYIRVEDPKLGFNGANQFTLNTYKWLEDKNYKDIVVAGVTHKMTLKKWLMRHHKHTVNLINQTRKQSRVKSINKVGYYFRQPTHATIPLWQDYEFLKKLVLHWRTQAEWQVNQEETVKTLIRRHPLFDEAKKLMNLAYLSLSDEKPRK